MTAEQIRFWAQQGIEFGAHSRTHAELTSLGNAELNEEIAGSAQDLSEMLHSRISAYAYPYGSHNKDISRFVRRVFDQAFTIQAGLNHLRTDPMLLHRTMVAADDSWIGLLCRAQFGCSPMDRFRRRVRARLVSDGQRAAQP